MSLLTLTGVAKSHGAQHLFDRVDLQVAAGLEVDVAELDPLPPRLLPLLTTGRHRPHQRVGVEQVAAHAGQDAKEWLGHGLT